MGIDELSQSIGRLQGDVNGLGRSIDGVRIDLGNLRRAFETFGDRAGQTHDLIESNLGTLKTDLDLHKVTDHGKREDPPRASGNENGRLRLILARYRTEAFVSALVAVVVFIDRVL